MLRCPLAFIALLAASSLARAQEPAREAGRPYVESFTSEDYGEITRTSGIAQDRTGVLYAGNQDVVLAFDGQAWRSIRTGTGPNVVLATDTRDRIWVGGLAGFGRLDDDGRGGRVFRSFREAIPAGDQTFGVFLNIAATTHGVYFIAEHAMVRVQDDAVSVLRGRRGVGGAGDTILAVDERGVLQGFDGRDWRDVADFPELRRTFVTSVQREQDGAWLLCLRGDGLWRLRNGQPTRLTTDIDSLLREAGDHQIALLRDGTIVVASWSGPIAFLRPDGRLLHWLESDAVGRPLARARGIVQDRRGDVWVTHANGIVRIPWPAPLTVFDFASGLPRSTLKGLQRLNGRLYAATSDGLFVLEPAVSTPHWQPARFSPVPGSEEQVWDFVPIGADSFVLTGPSVRIVQPGRTPVRLSAPTFSLSVLVPPGRDDLAVIGVANGLQVLRHTGNDWRLEPLPGSPTAAMDRLRIDANDALWIGSTNNGYYRLPALSAVLAGTTPAVFEHYSGGHGETPAEFNGYPRHGIINGAVHVHEGDSIYAFDSAARRFVRRFQLPREPGAPAPEILQMSSYGNSIWLQARLPDAREGSRNRHEIWRPTGGALVLPRAAAQSTGSAQAFLEDVTPGGSVDWIAGDEGIVRVELPAAAVKPMDFKVVVRRVLNRNGIAQPWPPLAPLQFADDDALTVEFSTDRIDDRETRFQTKLEGRDSDWSPPARHGTFNAAGMRPGRYLLRIRATDSENRPSAPAEIAWVVLPPWWQTWWALAGDAVAGLGLVAGGVRWRLRAVQRRNEELEKLIATRTHELSDAKVAAESANHAKSAFLANMSHELRTPLNAILGYAQILRKEDGLSEKGRRQLGIVGRNGEHLLQMINEVLDLAKIEAGKMTAQAVTFPLTRVVKTAADLFEQRAADKGLAFRLELGAGLPKHVSTDEQKLRQVLFNLLGNAVKFTEAGEVVLAVTRVARGGSKPEAEATATAPDRLAVPPVASGIRFEVRDTGVGIAPDQLRAIFEPFHQATPAAATQGTGLGLPISQRIVELLGGTLHVESPSTPLRTGPATSPPPGAGGPGSRFWFDLALSEAAAPAAPPATLRTVVGYRGARRRLLVVDDEPTNRAVLRDLLEPLGFVIEEAGDGAACLASFARQPCDLLLLDLRMPVLGGLDTVPRLRALPHGRTLPIIAVSASVLGFNQGTALTAGCDDFLAKPVQEKELLAALDRALRLEWIWRETAAPFEPAAPLAAHDALPDAATLDALLALARGGDVDALREQLAALLARGGAGAPFLREIDALAAGFKTAGIRQKLTDARQRSSSS